MQEPGEAALQETNAARDHMLLLGRGTAEEKFVGVHCQMASKSWAQRCARKSVAIADVSQGHCGFLGTHHRNRFSDSYQT
jgi:hypothetical protein